MQWLLFPSKSQVPPMQRGLRYNDLSHVSHIQTVEV
jgi:hypothetical protein